MTQLPIVIENDAGSGNLMQKNLWKLGWNYPDEGYDGFSAVKLVNTTPVYFVLEVDNTTGLISGPETSFARYYEMEYDEGAQEFYFQPQSSLITNGRKYNYALFKVVAVKNESGGYTPVASYSINDLKRISVTDELAVGNPIYLSEIPDYDPNGMVIVYAMW